MSDTVPETETEVLEEKVEETKEKIEEVKSNPEYATKEDISTLTELLNGFRTELAESKKKPKVPAPEKKEAEKPKIEEKKPTDKIEETKTEVKEQSYGSRRWFGGR